MDPSASTPRSTTEQMLVCTCALTQYDSHASRHALACGRCEPTGMSHDRQCDASKSRSLLCCCAGLAGGVKLLQGIADKYDGVSYADLFQMASAIAVKVWSMAGTVQCLASAVQCEPLEAGRSSY